MSTWGVLAPRPRYASLSLVSKRSQRYGPTCKTCLTRGVLEGCSSAGNHHKPLSTLSILMWARGPSTVVGSMVARLMFIFLLNLSISAWRVYYHLPNCRF